jgi:hypothetical protein
MKALFLVFFVSLASASASADTTGKQFDLACKGQQIEGHRVWHEHLLKSSFLTTIHIDLGDGSFCYDNCDHVYKLTRWDSRELSYIFDDQRQGFREGEYMPLELAHTDSYTVSLKNMRFRRDYDYETCSACTASMLHTKKYIGKCQALPFTGLSRKPDVNEK